MRIAKSLLKSLQTGKVLRHEKTDINISHIFICVFVHVFMDFPWDWEISKERTKNGLCVASSICIFMLLWSNFQSMCTILTLSCSVHSPVWLLFHNRKWCGNIGTTCMLCFFNYSGLRAGQTCPLTIRILFIHNTFYYHRRADMIHHFAWKKQNEWQWLACFLVFFLLVVYGLLALVNCFLSVDFH